MFNTTASSRYYIVGNESFKKKHPTQITQNITDVFTNITDVYTILPEKTPSRKGVKRKDGEDLINLTKVSSFLTHLFKICLKSNGKTLKDYVFDCEGLTKSPLLAT
eukprot:TRINITY_DN27143_c0_g1_i2.p2 TRINITY_DN27143_c0_g1~~TRINITY_DN27143_c0_g1_i2.p2  ORF type:complete len:106 (+),score=3.72 TRINITY_DN27143_c0_g1_i2:101-418(+)